MTREKVIDRLRLHTERFDTNKEAAQSLGVHQSYLCDVLKGRREPAGKLLTALGIVRVVTYKLEAR